MADAALVAAIQKEIDEFFELSEGDFPTIGQLFTEIAGKPVPPQVMLQLLGLPENAPPVCTKEQFTNAIKTAVDEGDTVEQYKKVFDSTNERLANSKKVMAEIEGPLKALHKSIGGDIKKIEGFFCALAPPPHTNKPMPPGMIHQLVRPVPTV
mmetsp:Transcript_59735/g.122562  ORF Transcript_59735/g.122562 Transcript_59735/m.122562 type:complete len:153 (+) Transcript_59735:29-487(+)